MASGAHNGPGLAGEMAAFAPQMVGPAQGNRIIAGTRHGMAFDTRLVLGCFAFGWSSIFDDMMANGAIVESGLFVMRIVGKNGRRHADLAKCSIVQRFDIFLGQTQAEAENDARQNQSRRENLFFHAATFILTRCPGLFHDFI